MCSWPSFRDFLAQHSPAFEVMVLVASCIPALLSTKKLWRESEEEKGFKKAWRFTELSFLWILPALIFFSSKATDWASDRAVRDAIADAATACQPAERSQSKRA
jgi:hypothetical protein